MGATLVALAILILVEDRWLAPWYPFLFISYTLAVVFGIRELLSMLRPEIRPYPRLCIPVAVLLALANWQMPIHDLFSAKSYFDPWHLLGGITLIALVVAFFIEMLNFSAPGAHTERVALTLMVICYLGVLPSFLAQLRWIEPTSRGTIAIAMTVFIPKCGDIGAYFTGKFLTGRLLGRNLMTPALSPKKTWQGAIGGFISSILAAILFQGRYSVFSGGTLMAIGFGATVGVAGQLGDLAESLLKRDSQIKDASRTIPGFGGVLDVIDSMIFAAPVAYLWFAV
jgi:phosphatidate cytidylyltransferase